MATEKVPKSSKNYECIKCNFTTVRKSQYDRHLLTRKHNNQLKSIKKFQCEFCGKLYVDTSGLWRHNKKCTSSPVITKPETTLTVAKDKEKEDTPLIDDLELTAENINDPAFILKLVEQNRELQNLLKTQQQKMHDQFDKHHEEVMKLIPQIGNNNNNTQFNLNLFLNEQCKDALNWNEFIQSIEVGMSDMEHVVESDITKGVVKVICNGIDKLGVYKRPIHCLDMKRKKLCLKNKDVWEKDSCVIKETLEMGNRKIQQKHIFFIKEWEERHPGWEKDEKMRDVYNNIVQQLMKDVEEDKCVNDISKHTTIPKEITGSSKIL
jgi:hypothetical protein